MANMSALLNMGTVFGPAFGQPMASVALVSAGSGATQSLSVFNYDFALTSQLGIAEGALAQLTQQSGQSTMRTAITIDGGTGSIPDDVLSVVQTRGSASSVSSA